MNVVVDEHYINYSGPASVNFDYTATCKGLQVDDWGRYKLAEYVVTNDIYVAYGTVAANTKYGSGGFTQFFIPSYQSDLTFTGTVIDLIH